jgi:peroxiredoxin
MIKLLLCFLLLSVAAFAADVDRASGSLGEALSQQEKTFSEKMPKDVVELYQSNINDQKKAGITKKALKVGDKVPAFNIMLNGKSTPISSVYAKGPIVLKFYRGGWCPYCMIELKHYDQLDADFEQANSQILAFSPDTTEVTTQTVSKNELSFDVFSDKNHEISRKFGLVYKVDQKIVDGLKKGGIDLSVYQGNGNNELAIPATYVVDKTGKIAFSFVDVDYRKRAEPSEVLKVVKALK